MYIGASLYFRSVADTGSTVREELAVAVPLLAGMVPLAMITGVFGGALGGREKFLFVNVSGSVGHTLSAGLPLVVAYFWTTNLSALIACLFVARVVMLPGLFWACKRVVPLGRPQRPSRSKAKELMSFGGWTALILAANSVIQTLDRLLIGSRIGAAAIPLYAIPYGLVSRIILIPHSLSSALYPRFAYSTAEERSRLTASSIETVVALITPATILLVAGARPFFEIWIGAEIAASSAPLCYVLAGGFWLYCIGHMAYSMLQATGRPNLVSRVLLAELIPYAALLVAGLWLWGLMGAAAAFTARAAVDCFIFLRLARVPWRTLRHVWLPAALTGATIVVAAAVDHPVRYLAFAAFLLLAMRWSLINAPEALAPYLNKLRALAPQR
jgi:O-antigen/teichoic acid export membrane protein